MRLLAVFFMLGVAVSGYYVFLRSGRSASEASAEDRGGTGVALGIKEQAVRVGGAGAQGPPNQGLQRTAGAAR